MFMNNANKRPKTLPLAKELQQAQRRRKVHELSQEGVTQREIAKRLGVSKSLVSKDVRWIKDQGDRKWVLVEDLLFCKPIFLVDYFLYYN